MCITTTIDFDDLEKLVFKSLCRLFRLLRHCVYEFPPGFSNDDLREYAVDITRKLRGEIPCGCGRPVKSCWEHHTLAGWNPDTKSLWDFVECAVAGDLGLCQHRLAANSVMDGMMGRVLHDGGFHAEETAWKVCPACFDGENKPFLYEGGTCPQCKTPFDPFTMRLVKRRWLVVDLVYKPILHYRCGTATDEHFYTPVKCLPKQTDSDKRDTSNKETYTVVHGKDEHDNEDHDYCPLNQCPNGKPKHPQNPFTLFTRWVGLQARHKGIPPQTRMALIKALAVGLEFLPTQYIHPLDLDRDTLCELFVLLLDWQKLKPKDRRKLAVSVSTACGIDDVQSVLDQCKNLTPTQRDQLRDTMAGILAEWGIDETDVNRDIDQAATAHREEEVNDHDDRY